MKFLAFIASALLIHTASAAVIIYKTVPFNNVTMHKNDVIQANYNFGKDSDDQSAHDEIFCYDPSLTNVGKATWTYKNDIKTGNLPILLKISGEFSGQYADRVGTLTIKDTSDADFIYMSCNFFG